MRLARRETDRRQALLDTLSRFSDCPPMIALTVSTKAGVGCSGALMGLGTGVKVPPSLPRARHSRMAKCRQEEPLLRRRRLFGSRGRAFCGERRLRFREIIPNRRQLAVAFALTPRAEISECDSLLIGLGAHINKSAGAWVSFSRGGREILHSRQRHEKRIHITP